MIKIYEEVFWVLLSLLCCVLLILGSVKLLQMISEKYPITASRVSRIVFIGEEAGFVTVVDRLGDIENQDNLTTIKQSYKNLPPPLYSTLSKATSAFSTYELPPPYPINHV